MSETTEIPAIQIRILHVGDGLGEDRYVGLTLGHGYHSVALTLREAVQLRDWLNRWIEDEQPTP